MTDAPPAETPNAADLLAKIGRGCEKKLDGKVSSWEDLTGLYNQGAKALEAAGMGVKERR